MTLWCPWCGTKQVYTKEKIIIYFKKEVDISDDVQADVAALIRSGAIEPMPAEPAADVSARNDGEADSG
jgi:hypothetical protein